MKNRISRKILASALAVLFLLTFAMPAAAETRSLYQATGNVNVRTGPSTSYQSIGKLQKGENIYSTGTTNGWAQVEYMDGTAYVSLQYLKLISSGVSDGNVSVGGSYMEAIANVNVRSGPGTNYSKLGTLTTGTKIPKNGVSGSWVQTVYNGQTAYVSATYLKDTTAPVTNTPSVVPNTNLLYATKNNAPVYRQPSTSSSTMALLDRGDSITYVSNYSSGWYTVTFANQTGYVRSSDFQLDNPATSTSNIAGYYNVAVANASYYSSTSTSSYLGRLSRNTRVYVEAVTGNWARCVYNNERIYMYADDLDIDTTSTSTMSNVNDYWYATQDGVYCYYSMSTSTGSNYAGYLDKNEEVLVKRANSSWAECQVKISGRDTLVYVQRKYLNESSTTTVGSGGTMYGVNETWYANRNNAPIYETTNTASKYFMGNMYAGEEVEVLRANSTWAEVRAYNSDTKRWVTGYVEVRYLDEDYKGYTTSSNGWTYVNRYYYTNARIKCYSKMNTTDSHFEVDTLSLNTKVYVEATNGTWAAVTEIEGKTVYVYIERKYLSTKPV